MTSPELDNLVRVGQLKAEPPTPGEVAGLRRSGEARLVDAQNAALALESRFDLAYNAAHALSLAALRRLGYRATNRYVVFQALPHTLGLPAATWRVLALCHETRNRAEYEGLLEIHERLVVDLVDATRAVREALRAVTPGDLSP
jgi:hypothetical protein